MPSPGAADCYLLVKSHRRLIYTERSRLILKIRTTRTDQEYEDLKVEDLARGGADEEYVSLEALSLEFNAEPSEDSSIGL